MIKEIIAKYDLDKIDDGIELTNEKFNNSLEDCIVLAMKEYAKYCCDLQKKICVENAIAIERDYNDDWCIEENSILNAPYPKELQDEQD